MRSMPIGVSPSLLARMEGSTIRQTFFSYQTLQRGLPMMIIMRAIVGLVPARCGFEFAGECARPFFPSEMPLLGEFDRQCERLGLPRFGKHRPIFVARQTRQQLERLIV